MADTLSRRNLLRGALVTGAVAISAACGAVPVAPADAGEEGEAPKAAESAPKDEGPKTVNFLHVLEGQNETWRNGWAEVVETFEAKNPGHKIAIADSAFGELPTKAAAAQAGGIKFDIIYGYFGWVGTFVAGNIVQPLDPIIATDPEIDPANFHEAAKWIHKGQNYGVAWWINSREIWYNKSLIVNAGLKTPTELEAEGNWTWDAALEAAINLTKVEGDEVVVGGMGTQPHVPSVLTYYSWAWGAEFWNPDCTQGGFGSDAFRDAVQFQADTFTKHRVQGGNYFEGNTAIYHTGHFQIRRINEQVTPTNLFEVGMAPTPNGPGGRKAAYAVVAIHLGSQSENPEGGWEFIKHTVIGDLQEIWVPQGGGRYPADLRREPITTKDYEDASVYKTIASIANATPTLIQQGDFNDIWRNETWPAIVEGAITVPEALQKTQDQVQGWLDDRGCLW